MVTGYGRLTFEGADQQISEVSCHAKGMHFLNPDVRTLVDIGGQDVKAMRIGASGRLENFVMNDKCAAGTGRFLEVMAKVLNVSVAEMGDLSAQAVQICSISVIRVESISRPPYNAFRSWLSPLPQLRKQIPQHR